MGYAKINNNINIIIIIIPHKRVSLETSDKGENATLYESRPSQLMSPTAIGVGTKGLLAFKYKVVQLHRVRAGPHKNNIVMLNLISNAYKGWADIVWSLNMILTSTDEMSR